MTVDERLLIVALRELLDEQNGPPLIRRQREWEAAVNRAADLLARLENVDDRT